MVQLNDTLLEVLDQRATETGRSRSDLIREAIEQYYKEDIEAAIDRAMVEGYTRVPDDDELDALHERACPAARSPRSPGEPGRGVVGRSPGRRPAAVPHPDPPGRHPGAVTKSRRCRPLSGTGHPLGGPARSSDDGMPGRCVLNFDNLT